MARHRLMWFVVGVGIVVLGHCALGGAPREAPEVLEIKVIDIATGKAMPGVSLRYVTYSAGGRTSQSGQTNVETTSLGPGGTTALTWSQVSKYYLTFSFSIGKRSLQTKRTVKVTDANAASLILRIPTDRYKNPLIVTVLGAATGKPVPRARINLSFLDTGGAGSTTHEWAQTTAGGKAIFNWAGEGKYRIWCSQIDGLKITAFYRPSDLTDDEWKAGKLTWKIKVPKLSARVKVFLLSKGKKTPAPDGAIFGVRTVRKDKSPATSREVQTVCKDGKAEIYSLQAGSVNTFCALSGVLEHKSGVLGTKHAPIGVKPWTFKGKVLDLEVTLVPAGEYRGKLAVRVTDEKGAPVEGVTVELGGAALGRGVTNSVGLTAWSGLHIGRYTVSVRKAGYPVVSRSGISLPGTAEVVIMLAKGQQARTRPVTGGARPTGWPLAVTVLDAATGKPVPGARLAIVCPKRIGWRQPPLQNTGAGGKAHFQGTGPGTHTLYCSRLRGHHVFHVGLRRTVAEAEWNAGKVTWKMKVPKVSVRVKVFRKVAGDKHPAPDGLNVALWRRGPVGGFSSRRILASCKDGRAEFYGLKVGRTYQIIYAHWATTPTLTPYVAAGAEARKFQGKVVDMEVTLIPHEKYRGRLQVTVVDKGGKAVEGAEVKLGRAARLKATTDAKGMVAWSDLRAGWYEVRAYKKGSMTEVITVYLPGGEANTVTLGGSG